MEIRGIKLSVKLPALIVLSVFASALIIFALGAYMTRNSLRAVEMEASRNSVHAYAHAASFYLAEARSALETTAALPQIGDFASTELVVPALHGVPANAAMGQRNVAASMLKSSRVFEYIMLLKADGTIYLLEPYELQVKALRENLAFKNWYQELMSSGNTVISILDISNTTQRPTITIATPVRSSAGQVIGIWAGALKLEEFSQIGRGEAEAGAPQRYGYITDSRGLIIAHQARPKYVQDQTDFSSTPPVRAALAGHDGAMQYISPIEGQEELGAYMPLPAIGWAVVYVVPTQVAFAPLTQLRYATLSTTVIIAIIATIVGLAIVRQITKPLGQLTAAAVKMGTGDLSQRVKVTTDDEIGQLGAEFNRMAGSLAEKDAQLQAGKERLQFLLSATPAVIYTRKASGDYGATFISENVKEQFGYVPREFVEDSSFWTNHIHPEDAHHIFAELPRLFEHGHHTHEYRFLCKDGTYRWLYDEMKLVQDDAGNPLEIAGYLIDITERKQMEEAKARLASILEATPDFVGFADANDKHILYVNRAGRKMIGIGEDDDVTELKIPDAHPEWANKMFSDEILPAAIRDGIWRGECAFLNRDGKETPVLMVLIAHKAPNGRVEVFSTISRDITELKHAEEEIKELNEELKRNIIQLESANKELEAFSYSVSHDLRAPLRAIDGFSRVILEDYSDKLDDEGARFLNIIRSSTNKMGQLIDDLLMFSRLGRQEIKRSEIDMDKLTKTVFRELEPTAHERKVEFNINNLPPSHGDRAMIRQVLVNLLSNAIKFTRPKETAMIEVGILSKENENIYYVKDNGVGFDMKYVNKLFGVFQRLHSSEEFEGTGVGLANVQRIIHRHDGRVWAEGEVGKGATFYFSLSRK